MELGQEARERVQDGLDLEDEVARVPEIAFSQKAFGRGAVGLFYKPSGAKGLFPAEGPERLARLDVTHAGMRRRGANAQGNQPGRGLGEHERGRQAGARLVWIADGVG